jgi:hypothetical protein
MEQFFNVAVAALVISGVTEFMKGRVPVSPVLVAPVVAFGFNLVGAYLGYNSPDLQAFAVETMVEAMTAAYGYDVVRKGIQASGVADLKAPPEEQL